MKHNSFKIKTADKLELYAQYWVPSEKFDYLVCLVHGIGEHSGRYAEMARAFNEANIGLVAFDQRGHGYSGGKRGHTPSYNHWMDDISRFAKKVEDTFPQPKKIIYGHSLGGNQAIGFVLRNPNVFDGLIASAPALKVGFEPPLWKRVAADIANAIYPALTVPNGLDRDKFTHDKEALSKLDTDELYHDKISARAYKAFYTEGLRSIESAGDLKVRTLIMHGSDDCLTSPEGSSLFVQKAGEICDYKKWDHFYHEIHNELKRSEVFGFVISWIRKNITK